MAETCKDCKNECDSLREQLANALVTNRGLLAANTEIVDREEQARGGSQWRANH